MKIAHIPTLALFLLCIVALQACTESDNLPSTPPQEILVGLQITPSLESDSQPLSRAASLEKGIYAVNIWWSKDTETLFFPYASGLFDDISNINIGLIEGYIYRFDCSFIMQSEIYRDEKGRYGLPFSTSNWKKVDAIITNKLTVSISPLYENTTFHQHIYKGATHLTDGTVDEWPTNIRRFYGTQTLDLREYLPITGMTSSSVAIDLELKRCYYTLTFAAENLVKGASVKIEASNAKDFIITGTANKYSYTEDRLYCMKEMAFYQTGTTSGNDKIPINVYYRPKDETGWTLIIKEQFIIPRRNRRNLITIKNIDEHYQGQTQISFEGGKDNLDPSQDNEVTIG